MVSKSDPEKFLNYLVKNDYLDVAIFLITSLDNLRNRGRLLRKDLDDLDKKLNDLARQVSENPDAAVPDNLEVSQLFKDVHYNELEIIQRINILIELLAVSYHFVRKSLRDLPKAIGPGDIPPGELRKELKYFVKQDVQDVWRNFQYPDVTYFAELNLEEQSTLKKILIKSAQSTLEKFKEVYLFRQNFRTVYNKYKHSLSEVTGVFGIDRERLVIQSHIFVRHKEDKTTSAGRNGSKYYTYVIPVDFDTVKYFDLIARNTWTLLEILLNNALHFLANQGKPFIPIRLFVEDEEDRLQLDQICNKVTSYVLPHIKGKSVVEKPDQKIMKAINKAIKVNHIYRMSKDIFDSKSLLTEGVTISRDH